MEETTAAWEVRMLHSHARLICHGGHPSGGLVRPRTVSAWAGLQSRDSLWTNAPDLRGAQRSSFLWKPWLSAGEAAQSLRMLLGAPSWQEVEPGLSSSLPTPQEAFSHFHQNGPTRTFAVPCGLSCDHTCHSSTDTMSSCPWELSQPSLVHVALLVTWVHIQGAGWTEGLLLCVLP